MGTTAKGIHYPDPTAKIKDTSAALATMSGDVDALLPSFGSNTISGTSLASGGILNVVIPFGFAYAVAPRDVDFEISGFVSNSSLIVKKGVNTITTTGFTASLVNVAASAATWTALPIKWKAVP